MGKKVLQLGKVSSTKQSNTSFSSSNKALVLPGVNVNMNTSCGKQHPLPLCLKV